MLVSFSLRLDIHCVKKWESSCILARGFRFFVQVQHGDYTELLDYESADSFLLFQTWKQAMERSGAAIKRASTNPSQVHAPCTRFPPIMERQDNNSSYGTYST